VCADAVGDPVEQADVPEQAAAQRLEAEAVEHERVVEVAPEGDPGSVAVDLLGRDVVKLGGERVESRALAGAMYLSGLREDLSREADGLEPGRRWGGVEDACPGHQCAVAARIA
jgi:hypothetical protein